MRNMDNSKIGNNVVELIKNGKTYKAIECLLENATSNELKGELVGLLSRLSRNDEEFHKGLKTQENKNVDENKIVSALIHCLGELSNDEKLISKNSIQKEKVELLISDIRFRENIRYFNINGQDELCNTTIALIKNIIDGLKEIQSTHQEVTFALHEGKKDDFELCITWINPIDKKDRTLVFVLLLKKNVLESRLDLALFNGKIHSIREYNARNANHARQVYMESYNPILNAVKEISWKGKKETLQSEKIIFRVIEFFLINYNQKDYPINQSAFIKMPRGRSRRSHYSTRTRY